MTAPSRRQHRPDRTAHPLFAAFVRFVVCGGGVGLASSGVLVLLSGRMPMVLANALITVVSTVIATELHSRISFRSERRGWGIHLQSGLTVAVSYAFTTAALLILHAVQSAPSALVEQGVYLSASALAGVGRFALLRVVVFAKPEIQPETQPETQQATKPATERETRPAMKPEPQAQLKPAMTATATATTRGTVFGRTAVAMAA